MVLRDKVIAKISEVGVKKAAKIFGVSTGTVSNWSSGKTLPSIEAAEIILLDEVAEAAKPIDPQGLTMWEGRQVAILMPVYRTMNPDTHFTLFANYVSYGPSKICIPKPVKGTCIWEARNIMINQVQAMKEVKKYIFVDDDMILPHGHVSSMNDGYGAGLPPDMAGLNAISRITSHSEDKGIIGALYFGRHAKGRAQCASGFMGTQENDRFRSFQTTGIKQEHWVGTGFMKIESWVIDRMKQAIDDGKWPECRPRPQDGPKGYYGYFNPIAVGIGEDVSFCTRAAEIGIQTWLDASLVCLHNGEMNWGPRSTHN